MIECRDLCVGYGEKTVLKDVNFQPVQGALNVIVGPNGCGKSTLLKTIMGQVKSASGGVWIDGKKNSEWSGREFAKRIAYLPQSRAEVNLPVARMVLHGRFPYIDYTGRYTKADYRKVDEALERLGILSLKEKNVSELSGGEKQKTYLAMALAQDTEVLILDEPTSCLDIPGQLELLEILKALTAQGKTVITVLHDLNQALRYGDYILIIPTDGAGIIFDTPEKILQSANLENVFNIKIHCWQETNIDKHYTFSLK